MSFLDTAKEYAAYGANFVVGYVPGALIGAVAGHTLASSVKTFSWEGHSNVASFVNTWIIDGGMTVAGAAFGTAVYHDAISE